MPAIAAHIPSSEIGTGYFQETHPHELFRECSVYAEHVSTPEQMPRLLRIAMREAIAKQGVAVLVIPGDIGLAAIEAEPERIDRPATLAVPGERDLAEAADALNAAKEVTILAGAGSADAHDEVLEIARRRRGGRSTRSTSRASSTSTPPRTRYSSPTSALPSCGRPATCG